jgi:hypothetical protein
MDESTTPDASVLELDEVFTALGHPRRRYLIYALSTRANDETLTEIARKLTAWEQDVRADEVSEEDRRRVHASLYHSHVPKLADLGIIEYETDENIIIRASNIEQVEMVLDGAGAELDSRQEDHANDTDA